ncbi:hypothetical protein GOM44_00480 [Wolbachia endosymbiont of Atemnus politus]|uniref:hypothetical protein n=1 Tax=Wolbachia endosymbiont of Atemnus politus TaxID=2682840 RepID=UPI0015716148|nr:hypothetical protein [Wolbachia endosymbiont of Atemnus politus]NSX83014.1 hypothetical protein [Wolbachia endosymbiont of Atemnus politus]
MISLFYRLRLLSYILGNLKDIVVKLFLLIIYLYTSSVTFMFLSNGFWYAVEFGSFKNAFSHLFEYCKWYYDNKDDLSYGVYFRILVAFLTPHFLYKLFLSTGWKFSLKGKITQILRFIITGRKGNKVNHNSKSNGSSYRNGYSGYGHRDEHYDQDAKQKVDIIKQLLVKDIEEVIDKRLDDIFLSERNKSH